MINSRALRFLLATSMMSLTLAGSVEKAEAVERQPNIDNARYSSDGNWVGGAKPVNNDWIQLNNLYNVIADNNVNIAGFDLNGNSNLTLTVSNADSGLGSIYDTAGKGSTLNIAFGYINQLTLNGTSTNVNIPQHDYSALGKVNLDGVGTIFISPSNANGLDFSNTMFYGQGTVKVVANDGGLYGNYNVGDIILGGVLGFDGSNPTTTNISIGAGSGQSGSLQIAGGRVIINAINTTGNVSFNPLMSSGTGGSGNAGGQDGGNAGDIIVLSTITASGITIRTGSGGTKNGAGNGGVGSNISLQGLVKVTNPAGIAVTLGAQGGANGGNGGYAYFAGGIDLSSSNGGLININNNGAVSSGAVIVGNDIIGITNTTVILMGNLSKLVFDATNNPISITGKIIPIAGGEQINITGSNPITFNDSVTQSATGKFTLLDNTPIYLGSNRSLPNIITATAAGATIMAASGNSATLNSQVNTGGYALTLGAISSGNTLSVNNDPTGAVNIAGAGTVAFNNNTINKALNFTSDSTAEFASGQNIGFNITASSVGIGTLFSSGIVSISNNPIGIKAIKFDTLKATPGNFVLTNSATVRALDFNNGMTLNIGNAGTLSYNTFVNTSGSSKISLTGTNSIVSTGNFGTTLPLITTSGNTTLSGNIDAALVQTLGSGNIILNTSAISGNVSGNVTVLKGANSFSGILAGTNINFTDSSGQLTILGANQVNNVTSITTTGGGNLILNGGTLQADIATSAKPLSSLKIAAGSTLNNNGKNVYAGSITPSASSANLNLSGNVSFPVAGSSSNPFTNISLNNFTVQNSMYAVNFDINGNVILANATLGGPINLASGSSLDASRGNLSGSITGKGNIIISRNTASNLIGTTSNYVGTVTLVSGQYNIENDIYGNNVIADNCSLTLAKSVQIANLSAQNLTLTPASNSLTLPNGGNLTGITTLNLEVHSLTQNSVPYIVVSNGKLHLSNLRLNITDNVGVGNSGAKILVIGGANDFTGTPDIKDTKLLSWNYDNSTGILSSSVDQKAVDKVVSSLQAQIPEISNYFDANNTGDAFLVQQIITGATVEQAQEIVTQLQSPAQNNIQSIATNDATLESIRNIISQQVDNYSFDSLLSDDDNKLKAGVSSGDDLEENKSRRVWISTVKSGKSDIITEPAKFSDFKVTGISSSGFLGLSRQGVIKNAAGSKTRTYGGTVGIDTRISERWMAGAALSYTENTTKMCNSLIGSIYKSKSVVASLYGLYNITNSFTMRTGLSYGGAKNTNFARRLVKLPNIYEIAYAKYNSSFISPDLTLSYRLTLPHQITFVPSFGLQYVFNISKPYTEIGAKPFNMTVKRRPEKGVLSGNIGLSFSTSFKVGDTLIKPEIHSSFKRALRGRNPTVLSKLDGAAKFLETRTHSTKKVTYSVGGSVTVAVTKMLDMGLGYDASLGEKYIAQRGNLRIRLNF